MGILLSLIELIKHGPQQYIHYISKIWMFFMIYYFSRPMRILITCEVNVGTVFKLDSWYQTSRSCSSKQVTTHPSGFISLVMIFFPFFKKNSKRFWSLLWLFFSSKHIFGLTVTLIKLHFVCLLRLEKILPSAQSKVIFVPWLYCILQTWQS